MAAEPWNPKLPFVDGSVDLTNPVGAFMTITALVVGFVLFHMADRIGQQGASSVNNFIARLTGTNVGGSSDNDPAVV